MEMKIIDIKNIFFNQGFKKNTHFATNCFSLVFALSLVFFFTLLSLKKNFAGYIGGMDGYYYGLLIKLYKLEFFFKDIDYISPLNYPPYYFYIIGKISNLLGISDIGILQFWGAVFSYFFFSFIYLKIVSKYLPYSITFLSIIFLFLFGFLNEEYSSGLMQKPHELLSLLFIPSYIFYIYSIKNNILEKKWLLITGFICGLSLGLHPAIILPSVIAAFIIFFLLFLNYKGNENYYRITFWFTLLLILISLPYCISFAYNSFLRSNIGPVLAITPDEFSFRFISIPIGRYWKSNIQNIVNITGLLLLIFTIGKSAVKSKGVYFYFYWAILFNFLFFLILKYSFILGYPTTAPHKYVISLQINSILGFFFLIQKSSFTKKIDSLFFRLPLFFFLISFVASYVIVDKYSKLNDINRGFEIGNARYNNLKSLSTFVEQFNREHPIKGFIAEGEARFLEYYLSDKITNKLFYNEDFVSPFFNFKEKIYKLKQSINLSGDSFLSELKSQNINLIITENHNEKTENIVISLEVANSKIQQIKGLGYLRSDKIVIPLSHLKKLIHQGKVHSYSVGGYDIYYILPSA